MDFITTTIPEVILIVPRVFKDSRGYFLEHYKHSLFNANGISEPFVQDNMSHSSKGTLRGLHYQLPPKAQGKLISVLQGEIFDVAVDIRKDSPTYGQWVGQLLNTQNHMSLHCPPGFAHGFYVTSETATVHYKCTQEYAPELERSLHWQDPDIAIDWPIKDPSALIISEKDQSAPLLKTTEGAL